ncbi:MAG: ATP-binding cassette domain-containing protein [Actinomycetota bacterium]
MAHDPIVSLEGVTVRVEGRRILGPVSMPIGAGERWVLLGPNGGGKTTLLGVIGARRQPSSGSARVMGMTFGHGDLRKLQRRIGHASHSLSDLFPGGLRVLDVVLTGTRSVLSPWFQDYDPSERARAEAQLAAVGCGELAGRGFATCSQGERQRVLLARAMVGEPRLLVLDEPSAGLDLPSREALIAALERSIRERPDLTVVLATHHLEEIPPSATHAALLRDGCLVSSGPIEETLTREHLVGCFGIDVEVSRRGGRWFSAARIVE